MITLSFSLIIVEMIMKNRKIVKINVSRNHRFQGLKFKGLCNDSSILVRFKKVILKMVGVPDGLEVQVENRAKCGKMVIFKGLK